MNSPEHTVQERLAWAREGADLFFTNLDRLDDTDFRRETALTGWTFAHLVGHVGYNAVALGRLTHWARTGVETPMYASTDDRDNEIEHGATLAADVLRHQARATDQALLSELETLPDDAWSTQVVTAQGRPVAATEIPWMRCREVWVHAVDLGTDAEFTDFPASLLDALLTDVTGMWTRRAQSPAIRFAPTDRDRTWEVVLDDAEVVEVTGSMAELTRFATGRGSAGVRTSDGGPLPTPGRWL
ncbi:maleylpyruvate isomerase family mycothiol-dependent enzyme [Allosaccharopolyspora coralli]|uniref:Maleylpyruvate isomerase family mycothiol-dependent enzyme n=1 Tax=Allosaccharopolyspora coralli TaxID=2665642 RepID=A0A5Q3Q861_9PSEU|nr:maleylpyruvate isomerase family mycothiol-dependent enzyme [Allosaccharopolyspora coralli]QGK70563.1 maleylpyruvate isomerase family mycothiol-dependent enzyme [Allosaccharopolyspora coralli]